MKRFYDLFKDSGSLFPKIRIHNDGFSVADYFSIRLSNAPKNLFSMMQRLTSYQDNLMCAMIYCFAKFVLSEPCEDLAPGIISEVFLTHEEKNRNLWLQHTKGPEFSQALNNTCGFFISNKKNVSYSLKNCVCDSQVYISGDNITDQLIGCISIFIKNNFCNPKLGEKIELSTQTYVELGFIGFLALLGCCICCIHLVERIRDCFVQPPQMHPLLPPPPPPALLPMIALIDLKVGESTYGSQPNYSDDEEVGETPSPRSGR